MWRQRRQRGTAPSVREAGGSSVDGRPVDVHAAEGNALAEFALVLPVLMMLIFGMIELGFAFSAGQSIDAAAREGARLASLQSSTNAEIVGRVDAAMVGVPLDSGPVVTVVPNDCNGRQGETITVTVTGWRQVTIPFVLDQQVALSSQAVFRCEA